MNSRQKLILKTLGEKSVKADWELAFGGKSYGNKHLFRVNKIIIHLLKDEAADDFITLAGGWIHDISLIAGNDDNPKMIKNISENFLKSIPGLTEEEISKIVQCASGHESGKGKLSKEAKIVHDADVIDKSGILGMIRHIWKLTNLIEKRELNSPSDLQLVKKHLQKRQSRIFTIKAGKIVKKQNSLLWNFLKDEQGGIKVMEKISHEAMIGTISDNIAKKLVKILPPIYRKVIINQLKVSFA